MSSITITYNVHPPTETIVPDDLPTSRTIEVPVNAPKDNRALYYGVLHNVLTEAKNQIGADLTIWRDAVGKLELSKETTTKAEKTEDDDEEEIEEEED